MNSFSAYNRNNGQTGIRNTVLVISGDLCCNPWSLEIASGIDNCHALTHKHGVGNYAPDRTLFKRIISGITVNPNVAGIVFVSSGNEDHTPDEILSAAEKSGKRCEVFSARNFDDCADLVRMGRDIATKLVGVAARGSKSEFGHDKLRIGLNCAGTDTVSAEFVHPVLGKAVDMITEAGGAVVFSETPDLIGLGDDLFDRCESESDRKRLIEFYNSRIKLLSATGEKIDDIEMVAFNTEGGLKTLKQKAGVSILKTGSGMIRDVVGFGGISKKSGLVFMDGPAMTDFVMTGYMAAGVQLMINTCGAGEGNKMPFTVGADTPSPILPVIKITGSTAHFEMACNRIDFDTAGMISSGLSIDQAAGRLIDMIVDVASGTVPETGNGDDFHLNIPMRYHQA